MNLLTQKTNFDSVGVKKTFSNTGHYYDKKSSSNTAGIEGNNLQSETHVNVNAPEKMFQTSSSNVV